MVKIKSRRARRSGKQDDLWPSPNRGDIPRHRTFSQITQSVPRPLVSTNYTMRQVVNTKVLTQTATAQFVAYSFQLSDLDNSTDLSQLFDQYKIEAVGVSIRPVNNAIGLFTNSTTSMSDFYCVIDYDDNNALTSTAQARQYDNCMTLMPAESGYRMFKPRVAAALYQGGFTGYGNLKDQWIDLASNSVNHYGIKIAIGGGTVGQTTLQVWELEFEYFVSFRSVR